MSEKSTYRPEIDGLRAIAVVAVVAFHAFPNLCPGGFAGVDVFFVISGYLITGIILSDLQRGTFSAIDFYARRVRRILPALFIVLLFCLCAGWFLLSFDEYQQLGRHAAAAAGFFLNFRLVREAGYFDTAAALKPLLHLWSLSVEEQFYLIWPFLLAIAWRLKRVGTLLLIVTALSFTASVVQTRADPTAAFFLPTTRFWELMVGAILAFEQSRRGGSFPFAFQDARAGGGLLLIAISFVLLNRYSAFPGYWALMPTMGTALVISSSADAVINRAILAKAPFVFVGLISYSLYLWHWPLLSFARIREGETLSVLATVFLILAAFALASATYFFVERPLREVEWSRFKYRFAPALLTLVVAVGLVGTFLPSSAWALFRFPPEIRALVSYKFDPRDWRFGECFPQWGQGPEAFAPTCIDPVGADAKPLLILWGDSQAAQLVPGLRSLQSDTDAFRFAQFPTGSCPPVLAAKVLTRPRCDEINNFVLEKIRETKPDVVVMAGIWLSYQLDLKRWRFDPSELAETVRMIQAAGAKRVVFMGQLPTWKISPLKVMIELFRQTHNIPDRTTLDLEPRSLAVDDLLRPVIAATGAVYISPSEYLCDQTGCVIQIEAGPAYFDTDHLTVAGSDLLIRQISKNLLPDPK
jgi:peptidoglycan/LPS O-acetylase OafA/YrhL